MSQHNNIERKAATVSFNSVEKKRQQLTGSTSLFHEVLLGFVQPVQHFTIEHRHLQAHTQREGG